MITKKEEIVGDIEGDKIGQERNSIIGFDLDVRDLTVNYVTVKTDVDEFYFKPKEIFGISKDGEVRTWIKVPNPFQMYLNDMDYVELVLSCSKH